MVQKGSDPGEEGGDKERGKEEGKEREEATSGETMFKTLRVGMGSGIWRMSRMVETSSSARMISPRVPMVVRCFSGRGGDLPPVNEKGRGDPTSMVCKAQGLTKVLPSGRALLSDIHISFYEGAKIGVLGLNGTGKSTLLKIIAGIEK